MNLSFIWLNLIFNNNYSNIIKLINSIDDLENIITRPISKWAELGLSKEILDKISLSKYKDTAKEILQKMVDFSEIKETDDTTNSNGFSFDFTPANSKF